MTEMLQEGLGSSRRRGFWLRCFLGPSPMLLALAMCTPPIASANVCVSQGLYVSQVHGQVTDQLGEIISRARITLRQDEKTVLESTADDGGDFRLAVPPGNYDLLVQAPGFTRAWTELVVVFGPKTWFRSNTLYVALAVGSLDCPPDVTKNRREVERQISAHKVELERQKQEHGRQK